MARPLATVLHLLPLCAASLLAVSCGAPGAPGAASPAPPAPSAPAPAATAPAAIEPATDAPKASATLAARPRAPAASAPPPGASDPTPRASGKRGCPAATTAASKAPWALLVQKGACVTLVSHTQGPADPDDVVLIESFDVRRVGNADVARLRYTRFEGTRSSDAGSGELLPLQVAVSKAGVHSLDPGLDDAAIAAELKKPPRVVARPKSTEPTARNGYHYVTTAKTAKGPVVCLGKQIPRKLDQCEDTCEGLVCVSQTGGIVILEGVAAPAFGTYIQPGYELIARQ